MSLRLKPQDIAMTRLRLHGPPVVEADGALRIPLSAREAALLAWLHLEGPASRARLAGLLWPAGTEAQARANLRQLLAPCKTPLTGRCALGGVGGIRTLDAGFAHILP